MGSPVVWFEVMGKDGAGLRSFYGDLFGWRFEDVEGPMDYGMVAPDQAGGVGGGVGTTPEGAPAYQTFYIGVDDIQASLDKAKSLGGTTTLEPMDIPMGGTIAMITDPEGHLIGLFKGPDGQ